MHQLMLLRHAKSASNAAGIADRSRPLTRRGERAAASVSGAIAGLRLSPELILASPARRTMQTLAALAPLPGGTHIETPEALYLADTESLLALLRGIPEPVASVLIIGHNPGLQELAVLLARGRPETTDTRRLAQSFPTAAFAEFALTASWAELGPEAARLVRLLLPRDLSEHAA
ncbi:MAG: SixA phosphatase family protein [Acetobacteraceae bacterium]